MYSSGLIYCRSRELKNKRLHYILLRNRMHFHHDFINFFLLSSRFHGFNVYLFFMCYVLCWVELFIVGTFLFRLRREELTQQCPMNEWVNANLWRWDGARNITSLKTFFYRQLLWTIILNFVSLCIIFTISPLLTVFIVDNHTTRSFMNS